jgi:hypothetical protein
MRIITIVSSVLILLMNVQTLVAQCPASIQKLNSRKIKYVFDNLGSEEPLTITYEYQDYSMDRSGSSDNFFSSNFLSHLPDHASELIVNYSNNSQSCVYDESGQRSTTAPVELSLFTAKLDGADVELHWITQTEVNNAEFEIQQSFDGEKFETIAFIDGAGNSNQPIGYNFVDYQISERATSNNVYYRLQQFDYDGTSDFSGIIAVDLGIEQDQFKITRVSGWNTGEGNLSVYYTSNSKTKQVQALLTNFNGSIYDQRLLYPEAGINTYEVNIQRIKSPVYIISLNNGSSIVSKKIALAVGY